MILSFLFGLLVCLSSLGPSSPTARAEESEGWNDWSRVINLSAQGVRYERIEDGRSILRFEADSLRLVKEENAFEVGPFRLILPQGTPTETSPESFSGNLEAQRAIYRIDSRQLEVTGGVKAVGEEGRLEAQTVDVDWNDQTAKFGGPVHGVSRGASLDSERLELFWPSGRMVAESVKMRIDPDRLGATKP